MALPSFAVFMLLLSHAVVAQKASACSNARARKAVNSFSKQYVKTPDAMVTTGFTARLINDALLKSPRGMVFDKEGNLLVVQSGEGISVLKLDYGGGGTCVSVVGKPKLIIADSSLNHAIQIQKSGDHETIFTSNVNMVYKIDYDSRAVSTINGTKKILINGLNGRDHTTRTLLLSKKVPGMLLVSRGSTDNFDWDATEGPDIGISQIRAFDLKTMTDGKPLPYTAGKLIGKGLRNSVGMDEDPITGGIWSNENASDDILRDGVDIHQDTPGEELNFHGYLNGTPSGLLSTDYGYPYCASAWGIDAKVPRSSKLAVGKQFFLGMENGTIQWKDMLFKTTTHQHNVKKKMSDAICEDPALYTPPKLTLPSHWAPIDLKFNSKGSVAYMTSRGSWDKTNPDGYQLFAVTFDGNGNPKHPSNSENAAIPILYNTELSGCPNQPKCIRPTGLAFDKFGNLFMANEKGGEIYIIGRDDGTSVDSATLSDIDPKAKVKNVPAIRGASRILRVREESTWGTLWKMFGALKV